MKKLVPVLAFVMLAIASAVSHAQTTYTVVRTLCPTSGPCALSLTPVPEGFVSDPVMSVNINNPTSIGFMSTVGPNGVIGNGVVTGGSNTAFTFDGAYIEPSAGNYTGTANLTIKLVYVRINRWTVRAFYDTTGTVTIN